MPNWKPCGSILRLFAAKSLDASARTGCSDAFDGAKLPPESTGSSEKYSEIASHSGGMLILMPGPKPWEQRLCAPAAQCRAQTQACALSQEQAVVAAARESMSCALGGFQHSCVVGMLTQTVRAVGHQDLRIPYSRMGNVFQVSRPEQRSSLLLQ